MITNPAESKVQGLKGKYSVVKCPIVLPLIVISNKFSVHTPVRRFEFAGHGCSYAVMDLQAQCL